MPAGTQLGDLTERITFRSDEPQPVAIVTLERVGARAVATTATAHRLEDGDYVRIGGATPVEYNATQQQVSVTGPTTFEYPIDLTVPTPAGGSPSVVFQSDSQGGQRDQWWEVAAVWAAMIPLTASERLQAEMVGSIVRYRAVIHYRPGLTAKMRIGWRPYREPAERVLEVHGVAPHPDHPRRLLVVECGELS